MCYSPNMSDRHIRTKHKEKHMAYIDIKDVKKSFKNKNGSSTDVLKGIDLEIEQGDIYGIIGYGHEAVTYCHFG